MSCDVYKVWDMLLLLANKHKNGWLNIFLVAANKILGGKAITV